MVDGSEIGIYGNNWIDGEVNWWAPVRQTIQLPEGGGSLPPITLYRRNEFSPITGFIYDSETQEPISMARIKCRSVEELNKDEPTRNGILEQYIDGAEFIYLTRHSMANGYYRTWAASTGLYRVEVPGYFPYETKIETRPVRGEFSHDVFMDPLVEERAWINGTLTDLRGDPISGDLNITDTDHPAMGGLDIEINETGTFSIETYPGNFLLRFYNGSLEDTMEVELTVGGIENLTLSLIPYSLIEGRVVNILGAPIEDIELILTGVLYNGTAYEDSIMTDAGGNFSFLVLEGNYSILIERTDLYGRYTISPIEIDGWNDWYSMLYLNNRTQADVSGTVLGSGGPFEGGIPGADIMLYEGEVLTASSVADQDGHFTMIDVDHGIYTLIVEPSANLAGEEGLRTGYLENTTMNFTVSGALTTVDPVLDYIQVASLGYVNVTYYKPNGTGVYLDAPIILEFSEFMDHDMVESSIFITPEAGNLSFTWMDEVLIVDHPIFTENTTYTVDIGPGATSTEGWPLWENDFSWSFTTGDMLDPWEIFNTTVILDGMNFSVVVEAPTDLTIYLCVLNVGYFQLSYVNASYGTYLTEDNFDYETTYGYFFTDSINGIDLAPDFAGTFTTPEEPYVEPVWEIYSADVSVTPISGDWEIEIEAAEGLTIYVVIENVGSFILIEGPPGTYEALVTYDNFEEGETYDYHFSDSEEGNEIDATFSGSVTMPVFSDGDDDDDDKGDRFNNRTCCGVCLVAIIVILLLFIVIILISRRKKEEGFDLDEE